MNHSLTAASRTTHLKIVVVALMAAIVVVTVGIAARVTAMDVETARIRTQGVVVKAGKPAAYSGTENSAIR
jgi:hypothetical protein